MNTKAVGYVRVSRVGRREGDSFLSPELQRESIVRVCQRQGLDLVEVLEELDRSGGDAGRPFWTDVQRVGQRHRSDLGTNRPEFESCRSDRPGESHRDHDADAECDDMLEIEEAYVPTQHQTE